MATIWAGPVPACRRNTAKARVTIGPPGHQPAEKRRQHHPKSAVSLPMQPCHEIRRDQLRLERGAKGGKRQEHHQLQHLPESEDPHGRQQRQFAKPDEQQEAEPPAHRASVTLRFTAYPLA